MDDRIDEIVRRLEAIERRIDALEGREGAPKTDTPEEVGCPFRTEERRIVDLIVRLVSEQIASRMEPPGPPGPWPQYGPPPGPPPGAPPPYGPPPEHPGSHYSGSHYAWPPPHRPYGPPHRDR